MQRVKGRERESMCARVYMNERVKKMYEQKERKYCTRANEN